MRVLTLQCAFCGSEDVKVPLGLTKEEYSTITIKCKCGKWLVKNGIIMSHKDNETKE